MEKPTDPFKNAAICTHCGYCLPVCPTYRIDNDETASPRGRVSIVLALGAGELTPEEAEDALSCCLLCRACHMACPAGVRPAKLVQLARNQHPLQPRFISRLLHLVTNSPRLTALAANGLMWYQNSGLQRMVRHSALFARMASLARLEALLPEARPREPLPAWPNGGDAPGKPRVALLCGCMARLFHPRTGPATANLLALVGCEVTRLQGFGCCGAPYRESGQRARFLRQARRTLDAFMAAGPVDAVLCDSASCAVTIGSYARALDHDPRYRQAASELAKKSIDFGSFLQRQPELKKIHFGTPGFDSVAYHDHCQTRFGLGILDPPRKLLDALPVERREIVPPGTLGSCCGAGGEYLLRHPEKSEAIRADKLDAIIASQAACIAASNPGCMLHLEAGLRQTGSAIQIRHLAELLWTAVLNSPDPTLRKKK